MCHSNEQTVNEKNSRDNVTRSLLDVESAEPQKLTYPKRIFLIIGNEFCERFNFYGMRAILVFYMKYKLDFTESDAAVLFHTFVMLMYLTCILGAVLSDVWLGKFRTILYLSILYAAGSIIVSISAVPGIVISPKMALYIGLTLIAFGGGGIKPCVSAFGGDQFKLPEQSTQMATYFSLFYFVFNAGSFISTLITPVLRADVHCFNENDCYSLAFGVPALLMILAILFFVSGRSSYTCVKTSSDNMLLKMLKCTWHAIVTKQLERKTKPRKNLLDYSIEKYGAQLVDDIRAMVKICVLYLPFSFFWTLSYQPGSLWTFQASKMNGDLGFYTMKPDQMQMVESLMVLIFIPLYQTVVNPALAIIGIRRPLQKLTFGGAMAVISFLLAAYVEHRIDSMPTKSVNILWQMPQYTVFTLAEAMVSVTGLSYSYSQAPESMKSVAYCF
ncbi:solute carrier family 15 member 2-like, partial [Contarinia nasturtii]|uniref:solute carrier family 15 member 2-like n=1 Tax=Contarinia nasturtii TaxID=265458 RepID=UPI0012D37EF2